MTLHELTNIADEYINLTEKSLPQNSFDIANQINIRVKNSVECKRDYNTIDSPLLHCNAIYAIHNGEYVVYYDEKYPYKNFAIAHEIAHHLLGHKSDGAVQHHDANLLAAILVAPKELIQKHKIKTVTQLAEICKIPIDISEEYWRELNCDAPQNPLRPLKIIFAIICCALTLTAFYNLNTQPYANKSSYTTSPTSAPSQSDDSMTQDNAWEKDNGEQLIYISKTGKKYHKYNCRHISGKNNLLGLYINEAIEMGYEACNDCFN